MDDKGFIFTADATLALVVVIVFTASIIVYAMLPIYQGQDHQHLEALADSILQTMTEDGTLYNASSNAAFGNTGAAQTELNNSLQTLVPSGIGYQMILKSNNTVVARDDRGILTATDMATRVKVISGPQTGWMGRAWYNIKDIPFKDQTINTTSTFWNFHNWYRYQDTGSFPNFGLGNSFVPVTFPVPDATINKVIILAGTTQTINNPFNIKMTLNSLVHNLNPSYAYTWDDYGTTSYMYSQRYDVSGNSFTKGALNNIQLKFEGYDTGRKPQMAWMSVIGNYQNVIKVPQYVNYKGMETYRFPDTAGVVNGRNSPQTITMYNLATGTSTTSTHDPARVMNWQDYRNNPTALDAFDDGIPFVINNFKTDANGYAHTGGFMRDDHSGAIGGGPGWGGTYASNVISETIEIPIDADDNILDATADVNCYGGVDGAMIEVWNGTNWLIAFSSFEISGSPSKTQLTDITNIYGSGFREPGYGNVPTHIYIGDKLKSGVTNKVRVTIWDDVPSQGYDLVGLVDSYATVTTSKLPVRWDVIPFDDYQTSNNINEQNQNFTIDTQGANQAYLFFGVGYDTKTVTVAYENDPTHPLYTGSVPSVLDLADRDAKLGSYRQITSGGTPGNYTLVPGTYNLKIRLEGSTHDKRYESGDGWPSDWGIGPFTEIFSGTRIVIAYTYFLNVWSADYSSTADEAKTKAEVKLQQILSNASIPYDPIYMNSSATYTGDMPNAVPVRLDLWKQ